VLRVYLKCWSFTRIAGAGALLRRDDMQPWYIILSVCPSVCRSRDLRNKKLERTLQRLSRHVNNLLRPASVAQVAEKSKSFRIWDTMSARSNPMLPVDNHHTTPYDWAYLLY